MKTILVWITGLLAGAFIAAVILMIGIQDAVKRIHYADPMRAHELIEAYNRGRKDALSLKPVSWDLDEACLAIWAGKNMK
jgi:hypothetical protein